VVISTQNAQRPNAVAVSTHGKCDYSKDGVTFTNLESGHIFEPGDVIRTGEDGLADLCFWRTGATVRLEAGTELKFEKMVFNMKAGRMAVDIVMDLRAGKILAVVRSVEPDSTLEIRHPEGRSVVEGSRAGRYIITADGTDVTDTNSSSPLRFVGKNGTTFVAPGEQFTQRDGKTPFVPSNSSIQDLAQLDRLQAVAEIPFLTDPSPQR
jgi:hypothetical protein